jgi:hypothetical protein
MSERSCNGTSTISPADKWLMRLDFLWSALVAERAIDEAELKALGIE